MCLVSVHGSINKPLCELIGIQHTYDQRYGDVCTYVHNTLLYQDHTVIMFRRQGAGAGVWGRRQGNAEVSLRSHMLLLPNFTATNAFAGSVPTCCPRETIDFLVFTYAYYK